MWSQASVAFRTTSLAWSSRKDRTSDRSKELYRNFQVEDRCKWTLKSNRRLLLTNSTTESTQPLSKSRWSYASLLVKPIATWFTRLGWPWAKCHVYCSYCRGTCAVYRYDSECKNVRLWMYMDVLVHIPPSLKLGNLGLPSFERSRYITEGRFLGDFDFRFPSN